MGGLSLLKWSRFQPMEEIRRRQLDAVLAGVMEEHQMVSLWDAAASAARRARALPVADARAVDADEFSNPFDAA